MRVVRHPIQKVGGMFFQAPTVVEFLATLRRLINAGDLCLICYGIPRCGKSTLIAHLVQFAKTKNSAVVFSAVASGTKGRSGSYARLARELASSRGGRCDFSNTSESEALSLRAEFDANELGVDLIIFLIDEAQELTIEQLLGLKETMQHLINRGLDPFVVQFAQPEILARPSQLMRADRASLVDRFFLRKHHLRGLQLSEFAGILAFYDTTRWPEVTGPTYTEHFLPDLWYQGWRMAAQTNHFKNSFRDVAEAFHRDADDIPIKFLIFAANSLLINANDTLQYAADIADQINRAVQGSGIVDSFAVTNDFDGQVTAPAAAHVKKRSRQRQ